MTVDLSPVLTPLLQLVGIVLTVVVGFAAQRLIAWLNLRVSASQVAEFNDAVTKSITYGIGRAQGVIVAKGWDHPDVKSTALSVAADYAVSHFPTALKRAGIDVADPTAVETYVSGALERAFPAAAKAASESPVTPPVPPEQKP